MSQPTTFVDDEGLAALGIEIGDRIGRYVVITQIGAGAMGMVLSAYDPELDRKAALKLLKRRAEDRPKARMRLRREAQALAKLHHPNIVSVYDVGVHEHQVFIAMEFVQGRSLAEWMKPVRSRLRPWREVLAVFVDAGRGLEAVHEAGLVHRDFKPDNVMIGDDGRVLVADFGLARLRDESGGDESGGDDDELAAELDSKVLLTKITKTGASLGTPAYMAPEQFQGQPASMHSDQFSFCVALFEALYGVLPYAGNSRSRTIDPPRHANVPSWLDRVVLRGLSSDASQRYASMGELLDALGAGEIRRRRGMALVAVAAMGFAIAGGFGWYEREQAVREADCQAAGDAIDRVWNVNTRASLSEGVLSTEVPYAPAMVDKLMPWLDRQAETWREHATLSCRNHMSTARWGTARWNAATHDKAAWCLEQHRIELELLVSELSAADAGMVEHAVAVAAGMSLVETCTNETSLATLPDPPDVELRPAIADIRRELMRATILERAGDHGDALVVARGALAQAEALGWVPLTAALRTREASLLRETGAYEEAELAGDAAYMEAARSGTWDVAAMAATKQAVIVGLHGHRPDVGKAWAMNPAVVAIAHAGDPFGLREAARLNNLAAIHWSEGEHEDAARLYEQVIAMREVALGPEHPEVAGALQNLGAARRALGAYEQARTLYERALSIYEQTLGPRHPQVATALSNLGNVQSQADQQQEARASYERALSIQREVLGPDHPKTATTLINLSNAYSVGEAAQKEALIREALAIWERAGKSDDPTAALARTNLGGLLTKTERYEEAEIVLEQALASLERTKGPEHPSVAACLYSLGKLYQATGQFERALAVHERALAIREKAFGPEHPDVGDSIEAVQKARSGVQQ